MSNVHLLWWILDFLAKKYPLALAHMEAEIGNNAPDWVKPALVEKIKGIQGGNDGTGSWGSNQVIAASKAAAFPLG